MSGRALSDEARRGLLQSLADIPVDADADDQVIRTFLPGPQHERALDRRVLVVRGERGAGKTALFHLLRALRAKGDALSTVIRGAPEGSLHVGFSERGTDFPSVEVVMSYAREASPEALRAFWLGLLVGVIHSGSDGLPPLPDSFRDAYATRSNDPGAWVPVAQQCLAGLYGWLDAVERAGGETRFVLYDHLDRIGTTDRRVRERVAGALLDLWLSLSQRYDRLRGKVMLREDLFQEVLSSFADATKLETRSVRLEWTAGRLYALLVRRMTAAKGLRDWLREVPRVELSKREPLGYVPSSSDFDELTQKRFAKAFAGEFMGSGATKGFTHTWMINHLQDARKQVTPRSLLVLVRNAAELAGQKGPKAAYRRLLHPTELHAALQEASERRVREQVEDHPVLARLESLRDQNLLLPRKEVVRALSKIQLDDGFNGRGDDAFEALIRIGALAIRDDRVDVPDIFRYRFGIKRKGGPRRSA